MRIFSVVMLEKLRWVQKTVEILSWIALRTGEI